MFARVATFEGVDVAAAKKTAEQAHKLLLPVFETMPGWMGIMDLADAASGKVFSVAIFNSAANAEAAEEVFDKEMPSVLGDLMKGWAGTRVSVDQCEVIFQLPRPPA